MRDIRRKCLQAGSNITLTPSRNTFESRNVIRYNLRIFIIMIIIIIIIIVIVIIIIIVIVIIIMISVIVFFFF